MASTLFVRPLTPQEHAALRRGLHSKSAFTLRRCQALLASSQGFTPAQIAVQLGCSDQSVRNALRAFHREGLAALEQKSSRPKSTRPLLDEAALQQVRELLCHSPREFGLTSSLWTLEGVAKVCFAQGITHREVSDETIRTAMKRLSVAWKRAKKWITSPDPAYGRKKGEETA